MLVAKIDGSMVGAENWLSPAALWPPYIRHDKAMLLVSETSFNEYTT